MYCDFKALSFWWQCGSLGSAVPPAASSLQLCLVTVLLYLWVHTSTSHNLALNQELVYLCWSWRASYSRMGVHSPYRLRLLTTIVPELLPFSIDISGCLQPPALRLSDHQSFSLCTLWQEMLSYICLKLGSSLMSVCMLAQCS